MAAKSMFIEDLEGNLHSVVLCPTMTVCKARGLAASVLGMPEADIRLQSCGHELQSGHTLSDYDVAQNSKLQVLLRLRGGGGDGGCHMVRRDCLLWVKGPAKKPQKYDKTTLSRILWTCCKKSNQPLQHPIVACELGFLYNKVALPPT